MYPGRMRRFLREQDHERRFVAQQTPHLRFFLRGLFRVQYAADQPGLVEQIDNQFPIEAGGDPPVEHLLNDIVDDIVQKVVERILEKEILSGGSEYASVITFCGTHDDGSHHMVTDEQLL